MEGYGRVNWVKGSSVRDETETTLCERAMEYTELEIQHTHPVHHEADILLKTSVTSV